MLTAAAADRSRAATGPAIPRDSKRTMKRQEGHSRGHSFLEVPPMRYYQVVVGNPDPGCH